MLHRGKKGMYERNEFINLPDGRSLFLRVFSPVKARNDEHDLKDLVLVFHDLGQNSGCFQPLAKFVTENKGLCAVFDLPGHGKSLGDQMKHGDIKSTESLLLDSIFMVTSIKKILGLAGDRPLKVIGHGFGALLLTYLLLYKKDLKVLLSSPLWKMNEKPVLNKRKMIEAAFKRFIPLPMLPTPYKRYGASSLITPKVQDMIDQLTSEKTLIWALQHIETPINVLLGEQDKLLNHEAIHSFMLHLINEKSLCTKIEGVGFDVWSEDLSEEFQTFFTGWLQES